ncbi:MAG: bifunctional folylpolyglutamate synthase/dihydrofolate synthase, partial [Planctomycetes bacterium]|nr:bifunctional folylpolyglutamate synthase/dihydrofolate synthase [Planctomycetota bacterium]
MSFATFADLCAALDRRVDLEREPQSGGYTLDRMRALVDELGHPERALRAVHVAGSKGKGSTCAAVASALHASGWRVGLLTSPHLVSARERIRLGPRPAPDRLWLEAAERVFACAAAADATWFELTTAIAFELFRAAEVDLAVVEVGLGGRLDATNVVSPTACVITRISLEHTAILGPDLATIAREKAGILEPG